MSGHQEEVGLEPVVRRPGDKLGWVYFIACKETERCKIGFTTGDVEKRMKGLQTGAAGELVLIAMQPGTTDTERNLHERFAEHRLHGEWFEMNEALFEYICLTVWTMGAIHSEKGAKPPMWIKAGLRMIREMGGDEPLPAEMEAML